MVSNPKSQVKTHEVHQIKTKQRKDGKARCYEPIVNTHGEDSLHSLVLIHAINVYVGIGMQLLKKIYI